MPPLGPEADTTLSYELAKWLAPILTSALIFTKISNLLFHFKNSLVNRFSRNHIIIFEKSDFTDILIHNLSGYKKLYRISLVTKDFLEDDRKKQYEKAGVSTYQSDFKNLGRNELKELSYNLNIKKAKYIILTSDNDLENYALFSNITKIAKPKLTFFDISDDGKYIAYGLDNDKTAIADSQNGQIVKTFSGHTQQVKLLDFPPTINFWTLHHLMKGSLFMISTMTVRKRSWILPATR